MLAIVPARGGSRAVKRKNLRTINGKPLILHTLRTLTFVPSITRIVVSTDDPEIAAVAHNHGYEVLDRPAELATDSATIADVAVHAVEALAWDGPVGVFQPTSPTLSDKTVRMAIREFQVGGYDSLCSVRPDTKLRWDNIGPLYQDRLNRQDLPPDWVETGGIFLARTVPIGDHPLVGRNHLTYPVADGEAHDIDTPDDLEAARRALGRKRIEFRIAAGHTVGAGHLYRCLALADELAHHHVRFRETPRGWVRDLIQARGYDAGGMVSPDLVVFDELDTTIEDVAYVKAKGALAVTLEDLGPGSDYADLVVNELYRGTHFGDFTSPRVVCGPRWAVLRPEFQALTPPPTAENARRILVMFGGTDPARLSERVSRVASLEGDVKVLLGPGASGFLPVTGVEIVSGCVSRLIREHDLVITSAGRTVHEAAACGVPVVSIAANERESRHSHCPGILRLGLHAGVSDDQIQETVHRLLRAPALRAEMASTARAAVDGLGARRFAHRVDGMLEGL